MVEAVPGLIETCIQATAQPPNLNRESGGQSKSRDAEARPALWYRYSA
jgi:hypothetical protein